MDELGDRFVIERELGSSVYFDTFKGQDTLLRRPVFLKVSKPADPGANEELHAAVIDAHLQSWRVWSRVDLPGVPRLLDLRRDARAVLVAEWIDAPSLKALGNDQSDVPMARMLFVNNILEGCLEVLSRLHHAGLIHGDISPGNILLRQRGRVECFLVDPAPSLRIADPLIPGRRLVLGTAGFQAPEIRAGAPMNQTTDVFALGAVIKAAAERFDTALPPEIAAMIEESPARRPPAEELLDLIQRRIRVHERPERGVAVGSSSASSEPSYAPPRASAPSHPAPGLSGGGGGRGPSRLLGSLADAAGSIAGTLGGLGRRAPRPKSEPRESPASSRTLQAPVSETVSPSGQNDPWNEVTRVASTPAPEAAWSETSRIMDVPMPSAAPKAERQSADFSIMAPDDIAAGKHFVVEVWAAPSGQRDAMLEEATRNARMVERGRRAFLNLERDTPVTVLLKLPDFEIEDPIETLGWDGDIRNVAFMVKAPAHLKPGLYPGMVKLLYGQAPFASISFDLNVLASGATANTRVGSRAVEVRRINRAFASYASTDRAEVLRRVQGIQAAGTAVFLDVIHLRTGEAWEPALYREIDASDGFYLFWSRNAAQSEWVNREWRYALDHHGLDFINPLALEDPRLIGPPPELSSKHFNDMLLAFIKAEDKPAG